MSEPSEATRILKRTWLGTPSLSVPEDSDIVTKFCGVPSAALLSRSRFS